MSPFRTILVLCTILFCATLSPASAEAREPYAPPVEYRQRMTPIVRESQVQAWLPTYGRYFHELAASVNGEKLGFLVQLANYSDRHIYVMNQDGTGVTDLTDGLLPTATASAMHKLEINDDGSRLFFFGVYMQRLFYFDTASGTCHLALDANGFGDFRKPYTLNAAGTSFTMKYNAGWDPVAQKNQFGIFRSDVGGPPVLLMHQDQIPGCISECQNFNVLAFIGAARTSPRFFITFERDYWGAAPSVGMWRGGVAGDPHLVPPAEYDYVWDQQDLPNDVVSADGTRALVTHMNAGQPKGLYLLDATTGAETLITETTDLNAFGHGPTISPDGSVARFTCNGYRASRVNLSTMAFRDTLSQLFSESACSMTSDGVTDITADNRFYFLATNCGSGQSAIYRIDMDPSGASPAPETSDIRFSVPALKYDDATTMTITCRVADREGAGNIASVRMTTLIEGRETPEWLNQPPLTFAADFHDDGANGDAVAGDGIYTNAGIRTNSFSNFWARYPRPAKVGIRIVAKDKDGNYGLADTSLWAAESLAPFYPRGLGTVPLLLD